MLVRGNKMPLQLQQGLFQEGRDFPVEVAGLLGAVLESENKKIFDVIIIKMA